MYIYIAILNKLHFIKSVTKLSNYFIDLNEKMHFCSQNIKLFYRTQFHNLSSLSVNLNPNIFYLKKNPIKYLVDLHFNSSRKMISMKMFMENIIHLHLKIFYTLNNRDSGNNAYFIEF